jgi:O-acetyl-ADP-ribose deacetylase (regulator of RNase III)
VQLECVRGDITHEDVDAIVNAANSFLRVGGGVDLAIHERAGLDEMIEACRLLGGCDVGDAKVTPGFNLQAKWVIHTVGPYWRGGAHGEAELLSSCYRRSLEEADKLHAQSVAFPSISTGIFGYPIDAACEVAVAAVTGAQTDVSVVRFVVFDEANERAYRSRLVG